MWKDIVNYEGLYQVNELGQVKSLKRLARVKGNNNFRVVSEKILKPHRNKSGYCTVVLCKNLSYATMLVHKLVAVAFLPNPYGFPCVNHKDANPSNNHIDNLEWCTYEYNSNYGICKQKQSAHMKRRYSDLENLHPNIPHPHAVCQISLSGELIKVWDTLQSTKDCGFNIRTIRHCANCLGGYWKKQSKHGFSKTHKGFIWLWEEDYKKEGVLSSLLYKYFQKS